MIIANDVDNVTLLHLLVLMLMLLLFVAVCFKSTVDDVPLHAIDGLVAATNMVATDDKAVIASYLFGHHLLLSG